MIDSVGLADAEFAPADLVRLRDGTARMVDHMQIRRFCVCEPVADDHHRGMSRWRGERELSQCSSGVRSVRIPIIRLSLTWMFSRDSQACGSARLLQAADDLARRIPG